MFIKVIVDIANTNVNQEYDYCVPPTWQASIQIGVRVLVPFGNTKRMGIVVDVIKHSTTATKDILMVLDQTIINELGLKLFNEIDKNPLTLKTKILETIIPQGLWLKYSKVLKVVDATRLPQDLQHLFKKGLYYPKIDDYTKNINQYKKLKDQDIIEIEDSFKQNVENKESLFITIIKKPDQLSEKGQLVFDYLQKYPEGVKFSYLSKVASPTVINNLVKKGFLKKEYQHVSRIDQRYLIKHPTNISLSKDQQAVYQTLTNIKGFNKYLLKGVTGSGKTQIYIELIKDVLKRGQKVLVLVPEIMLLGPMYHRLKSNFINENILTFCSENKRAVKYDIFNAVKNNEANIVIGTRSAIFLPITNLGLIVVDEAHDQAYIQHNHTLGAHSTVEYEATHLAQITAEYHQCLLLLGTATPSIEQMYEALETNKLLTLNQGAVNQELPQTDLVDMKEEFKSGNLAIISHQLKQRIDQALSKDEQVMILINRKGYAPFVMCRNCSYVPKDPDTDTALTYYGADKPLQSKYTKYQEPFNVVCPICGQATIKEIGLGTEAVEKHIQKLYPDYKTLRMDANSVGSGNDHEMMYQKFLNKEAHFLIGTQMITKGLDFKDLTVVAILMVDQILSNPGLHSNEVAYNLLSQAIGRTGRHKKGCAVIQGYDLANPIIKLAINANYDAYYQQALAIRKLRNDRPFGNISTILFEGQKYLKLYKSIAVIKKELLNIAVTTLGPVNDFINQFNGYYRANLTIKYTDEQLPLIKQVLTNFKELRMRFLRY